MCTWAPTPRVVASFRAVFPHVFEAEGGDILIGSLTPMPFEPEEWKARAEGSASYLGAERTKDLVGAVGKLRPAGPPPAVRPTSTSSPATSTR